MTDHDDDDTEVTDLVLHIMCARERWGHKVTKPKTAHRLIGRPNGSSAATASSGTSKRCRDISLADVEDAFVALRQRGDFG